MTERKKKPERRLPRWIELELWLEVWHQTAGILATLAVVVLLSFIA